MLGEASERVGFTSDEESRDIYILVISLVVVYVILGVVLGTRKNS